MRADDQKAPNIIKMVARAPFQEGEPLMRSKLANKDDPSFLAASLPEGMRAITIAANPISGVAGFVFPGDRVDVIITHEIIKKKKTEEEPETAREEPLRFSETLISDIRVLAINDRATAIEEKDTKDQSSSARRSREISSVTLEVDQADAQRLRLAERDGELSLVLRSLKDREKIVQTNPVGDGDLTRILPPSYFPKQFGP